MRADADEHEHIGAARAHFVLRVARLNGVPGVFVLQIAVVLGEFVDQRLRTAHHVDDLLAPDRRDHLPGLELADVQQHGRAARASPRGGLPGLDERNDRDDGAEGSDPAGGHSQELSATLIDIRRGRQGNIRHVWLTLIERKR